MCRNHRGFIEATVACSKLGASALYLNTAFAGPQITDVMRREDPAGADLRPGFLQPRPATAARAASASSAGASPGTHARTRCSRI